MKSATNMQLHLRYTIAIAAIALLAVVTFWLGGKGNEIVSYFSFASALVSIVLAVVVIFYTFYQAERSARNSERSEQNIGEMKGLISQTPAIIREGVGTITEKADVITEETKAMRQYVTEMTKMSESPEPTSTPMPELEGETFKLNFLEVSNYALLILYYTARAAERDGKLHLEVLSECFHPGEKTSSVREKTRLNQFFALGLLNGISCFLNPGSLKKCPELIEVRVLPEGFKDRVLTNIKERIKAKDGDEIGKGKLKVILGAIDALFEAAE